MNDFRIHALMVTLLAAISLVALEMVHRGLASWEEGVAFVTGALCVWLTVEQSIWNFPIGLVNVVMFSVVFFRARLFADAGLQIVYFGLGLMGWYLWLFGGELRSKLIVRRASRLELAIVLAVVTALTLLLWQTLRYVGGSASLFDALTTSISLGAQWLLNRKRLESWILWICVDILYVPLYLYKELYLTAALYAVFLSMAVVGYRRWRADWQSRQCPVLFPVVAAREQP